MPDRVIFGTVNSTIEPEQSSGFSGFPFPVPLFESVEDLRSELQGTYPVGVSLATALKWYWRVKTWTFNASGFFTLEDESPCDFEVSIDHDNPTPKGNDAVAELDLITHQPTVLGWGEESFLVMPSPDSVLNLSVVLFMFEWDDGPAPIGRVGDTYYPNIYAGFAFSDASWNSGQCNSGILEINADPAGTSLIEVDGVLVPAAIEGSWNASLSFYPAEYWPYANADGNPVWDTSTGDRTTFPNT